MKDNTRTIIFSSYDDIKNPHYGGGGAIAVHKIAKQLSRKYTIKVLCWDYCGKKKEIIDGVQYERFGFSWVTPKIGMFLFQLGLLWHVMQKKYDIWLESFCPPFTIAMVPLFTKKPVIGVVHMLAAEDMERKYKLPFHLIQNNGLKLYKNLIVTSEKLKQTIRHITPESSFAVISNGIDSVFKPLKKRNPYLLFLGRIEIDQKGLDLLLKAFLKVYNDTSKIELVIAGSGADSEIKKLKKLINSYGLKKHILFKGRVAGKKKELLLRNAMAVVVPSRFETFSMVALEAMAYGTPLICYAIEGLTWVPKNTAIKVKPFSVPSLAKAIQQIVSDRTLTGKITADANAYAKELTWDKLAQKYEQLIERSMK